MRFKLSKHYKRFMSDETDIVKQKELEDYYKYQIMLKNRQQNFIKLLKIIFIKKPILKRQSTPKNEIKDFNINLYFRITQRNYYIRKFQPYLFPLKKQDYLKKRSITDINNLPKNKKLKKINLNLEKNKNIEKRNITMGDRQTIIRIKKDKNGTWTKSTTFGKKQINPAYLEYLCNKRSKICKSSSSVKKNKISDNNSPYKMREVLKKINFVVNENKNKNKTNIFDDIIKNKTGYMTPFFKLKKSNNYWFIHKSPKKLHDYDDADHKKRLKLTKNNDKFLPVLYYNFDSTLRHSAKIINNIKKWNRKLKYSINITNKQKKRINKTFFKKVESPSMKTSLKFFENPKPKKKVYKCFIEKNGKINLKIVSNTRKNKATLPFVEDYNKARDNKMFFGRKNKSAKPNLGYGTNNNKKIHKIVLNG